MNQTPTFYIVWQKCINFSQNYNLGDKNVLAFSEKKQHNFKNKVGYFGEKKRLCDFPSGSLTIGYNSRVHKDMFSVNPQPVKSDK